MRSSKAKPNLVRAFWDVKIENIDFDRQKDFVISRVLEYGYLADIRWLLVKYRKDEIAAVVRRSPNLSLKTANFWSSFLDIPKEKILCLNKRSQKKRKMFWPY